MLYAIFFLVFVAGMLAGMHGILKFHVWLRKKDNIR